MNACPLIEWEEGLYVDAFVTDHDRHVQFLSLWGRDGIVQHFLASLTLPMSEGGLRVKTLTLSDSRQFVLDFAKAKQLKKQTTRLDKYSEVGEWVHLWLYDESLNQLQGQSLTLLTQTPLNWSLLWPTVKQVCHLPLLDSWQAPLGRLLDDYWTTLPSFGVCGTQLSLPIEDIEPLVMEGIQSLQLRFDSVEEECM